jgi:hypothetical protein
MAHVEDSDELSPPVEESDILSPAEPEPEPGLNGTPVHCKLWHVQQKNWDVYLNDLCGLRRV